MTSTGRCTAWMTLAIVKVLPEPVTPIKHLVLFPLAQPFDQGLDGLGLIAGGLEGGDELEHAISWVSVMHRIPAILSLHVPQFHG